MIVGGRRTRSRRGVRGLRGGASAFCLGGVRRAGLKRGERTHGSCVGRCGFGCGDARPDQRSGSSLHLGWRRQRRRCWCRGWQVGDVVLPVPGGRSMLVETW